MSKERARRRAEREAARVAAEAARLRRARRIAFFRRFIPTRRRWRWAWGLGRRSPGQRSAVIGVGIGALAAIWYFLESVATRIGLSILVLLVLPVFAVVTFDRKGLRL